MQIIGCTAPCNLTGPRGTTEPLSPLPLLSKETQNYLKMFCFLTEPDDVKANLWLNSLDNTAI